MRWLWMFLALCGALVTAAVLALWAVSGFQTWELGVMGMLALILGSALTAALAIGLMALVFHSSRSGHDDDAAGPLDGGPQG